jgi:AraC-like DNA-binding protein
MAIIAALLDRPSATIALRRTTPRVLATVRSCRTVARFRRLLETNILDAAVLGVRAAQQVDLAAVARRFPSVPLVIYGAIRADQASVLKELYERGAATVLVEGVDDPVVGELVVRDGYLARRRLELSELARRLRLTEPLQQRAFDRLLARVGMRTSTGALATALGVSREHLSRQFAAGGAPNLKRVIDLLQVLAAHDLLGNPGYPVESTVRLLGFADESHLRAVISRLVRLPLREFRRSSRAELQRRFVARGTRSRA